WVDAMVVPNALLSATLAVMHTDLYVAGREAMIKLGDYAERVDTEMGEMLERWSSVYGVISVMVNRESPLHRDYSGKNEWMDLLASVGACRNASFQLSNLRTTLRYDPGTVVAFSGRVLRHGASKAEGDRACLAYYMRDNVHKVMRVQLSNW
ncbi:hypothetical protein PAXRUDRAFT_121743, partial [Paxillus rubicundulus Ve08.2h10]